LQRVVFRIIDNIKTFTHLTGAEMREETKKAFLELGLSDASPSADGG
jgi:hypothetical protein